MAGKSTAAGVPANMGYEQPVELVDQLTLSPEQRKMILGATAPKILKLAVSWPHP